MIRISAYFLFLLFFISCTPETIRDTDGIPRKAAVGDISELIIVGPEHQLSGIIGDSIKYFFEIPFPNLPQGEPSFDPRFVFEKSFNDYEKGQANVIYVSVGDKEQNREGRVTQIKDQYARGQVIYTIYAPNEKEFFNVFKENKWAILKDLNRRAIERSVVQAEYANNQGLSSKVEKKFGLNMAVPDGFYLASEKENILSFKRSRETSYRYGDNSVRSHNIIDGLVIYRYDHSTSETFSTENQVANRNKLLGPLILSELDMPMKVEGDPRFLPSLEELDLNGIYVSKIRGLWRFDRPLKGGPFVSISFFHEAENYAITIDAYVFAPKFDKRDYIRELEGILHSMSLAPTE
ncbi:MAG: DUF4837 family protein [Bacteroidota bacterium]